MTTVPSAPDVVPALGLPAGTRALGRFAAVLALGSTTVHLLLADAADLGSLAMLGMALFCLPCAWHLWRSPAPGVWALTATVDAAMLLVHLQMLAPQPGHSHGAHDARGLAWLGAALLAAQLLTAGLAAVSRPRSYDR